MGIIKDKIQQLLEDDLRKKIIIPLLAALGCQEVIDNCGNNEKGKDILYTNRDHFLYEKELWTK